MKVLVIGAGPYGLAVAAHARRHGIEVEVHGKTMEFWRDNMPAGMLLRSGSDWHLDASDEHTFVAFENERGIPRDDEAPIPVERYVDYVEWFCRATGVESSPDLVRELHARDGGFRAELENGDPVWSDAVVAAPGIRHFPVVPPWVPRSLPPSRYVHTCELAMLEDLRGRRCLIIGGRQSAYEWAALLAEVGARRVDVVHRHPAPSFTASDWSFVEPLIASTISTPQWFRSLPDDERTAIEQQFWAEGRLKLEPWLVSRLDSSVVHRWPEAEVTECELRKDEIAVTLTDGTALRADMLVLATGYAPDLSKIDYLKPVLDRIETVNAFPVLDEHMQSSVPGLFLTGYLATRDFGPFFGFVRGCPAAARIIVDGLTTSRSRMLQDH